MSDNCAVCGTKSSLELRLRAAAGDVLRCSSCDTWALNDGRDSTPAFQNEKFDRQWALSGVHGLSGRRNRARARKRMRLLAGFLGGPGKTVLEIGPGTGHLLTELRANGYHATGLDQSSEAAVFAKEQSGLPVISGELSSLDAKFDAVISFHVIEHVNDPVEFCREAVEKLCDNGILVIVTPNHGFYDAVLPDRVTDRYFVIPEHRYYFSPRGLGYVARRVGLSIELLSSMESEDSRFYRRLQHALPKVRGSGLLSRAVATLWGLTNESKRAESGRRGTGDEVVLIARAKPV